MNITITADQLTIFGFGVGIVGFLIAIWQILSTRKARQMYREKCETRCKDLVDTVGQLSYAANQACYIKDKDIDDLIGGKFEPSKSIPTLRRLSDQIHSINVSKNQLVRFCERLNEEHIKEFKEPVFEDIRGKFADIAKSESRVGRKTVTDPLILEGEKQVSPIAS